MTASLGDGGRTAYRYISYKSIILYWVIVRGAERLFTNDADVNSTFSASLSHVYYGAAYTAATIFLFYCVRASDTKLRYGKFFTLQVPLYSYALISCTWSTAILVSFGQSVYSFYSLVLSVALCKYAMEDVDGIGALRRLIWLWVNLLIYDYIINVLASLASGQVRLPPLDQVSLIAIAVLLIGITIKVQLSLLKKLCMFWMFAAGQSFSAILSSTIIFARYVSGKIGNTIGILFFIVLVWVIYDALRLVEAGQLSIYGKTWEFILSGSGRFSVYDRLYSEIRNFDWGEFVFGRGYMNEREFLTQQYLSWAIDAHNNVLQSLYGLGLVGTTLMVSIWLTPFFVRKRHWSQVVDVHLWKILLACNIAFITFGLTSSHYFSRPSLSAVFMTSIFLTVHNMVARKQSARDPRRAISVAC
jgi:hypothetical protein